MIGYFFRNVVPFAPAAAMLGVGAFVESLPLILIGVALAGLHYELYKIKVKIENSQPWWY